MNRPAYRSGDDLSLFSATAEPTPVSTQFWVQLLRYRPILLLGSLWLGLICAAAVAYSRLMFAGDPPPTVNGNGSVAAESRSSRGQSRSAAGREPSAVPNVAPQSDFLAPDEFVSVAPPESANVGVSPWAMASVVGLSALGCFFLQRRLTAPARPRKARPGEAAPTRPNGAKASHQQRASRQPQATAQRSGPKRLQPFSPERDQIVVARRPPLPQSLKAETHRQGGVPPAISGNSTARPQSGSALAPQAAASTPKVTVVAPHESVPLDWPEGSLAHSLDIRQRRSLSSFM